MAKKARSSDVSEPSDLRTAELVESVLLRFRQSVDDRMADLGMLRRDLAEELGVSEGRVSQVLSSADNVTLRTIAAFVAALDADLDFKIVSRGDLPEQPAVWPGDEALLVHEDALPPRRRKGRTPGKYTVRVPVGT